jgi:hypothetical protein
MGGTRLRARGCVMRDTEQPEWASYTRERDDAQDADRWRYATPGQWVGGEWRTYGPEDGETR